MTKNFTRYLCTVYLLMLITQYLAGQIPGFKFYKNYSNRDYDSRHQNWSIVQDKRGMMYFGNQGSMLEFDGSSWREIKIPGNTARSLALWKDGVIYIGGNNEIGFLAPGNTGLMEYRSLLPYIDKGKQTFGTVWRAHASNHGIYFVTSRTLFLWQPNKKKMTVWETASRFRTSFLCNGTLFIRRSDQGLMKLENGAFQAIPGGKPFISEIIWMMEPYNDRNLIIGTTKQIYLFDGSTFTPFRTEADVFLESNRLYYGTRLTDGNFALATKRGGLIVIDLAGKIIYRFDRSAGLRDNDTKYVFQDNCGNLWLALNKGISMIEYRSPFFFSDDRGGLPGIVLSVARHKERLYAGTTNGLFALFPGENKFKQVPGFIESCWSLLSIKDSLLAATSEGVFKINSNQPPHLIMSERSFVLAPSLRTHGRVWCGTSMGISVLTYHAGDKTWNADEKWLDSKVKTVVRSILEDKQGNLWLGTTSSGVFHINLTGGLSSANVTKYHAPHGLDPKIVKEIYVFLLDGRPAFASSKKGLFRFDQGKHLFVPDPTLGKEFSDGKKGVFRVAQDHRRHVWFHSWSRNYRAVPGPGGKYTLDDIPFLRLPDIQVNHIYVDPVQPVVWFCSGDGLIAYNREQKSKQHHLAVFFRNIDVNGTTIYSDSSPGLLTNGQKRKVSPVLEYKDRNIRFQYGTCFYQANEETLFRFYMDGGEEQWSEWQAKSWKEYNNLDSGSYTFKVQAKDILANTSSPAEFSFRVLPPWYKTWWAYAVYAALLLLFMYGGIRWRSAKLEKEKQQLEQIVGDRTREVNLKNRQLEHQTIKLKEQSEKLQEMDRVKSRFFANISHEFRTPLTLITGPVEQLLSQERPEAEKKKLGMMLHNSHRLLMLINQLLDLSRFDSGRMRLQTSERDAVPFLEAVASAFQPLADRNKIKFLFQAPSQPITLFFNAEQLEEIVGNLIINAVKYTPGGGTITVTVSLSPEPEPGFSRGFLEISIRDTGAGIPKEHIPYIFDRFHRVESNNESGEIIGRGVKGTGIGLALTRELVLLHHGRVDVHSSEGKGTEFVVQLPVGRDHLQPGEIVAADNVRDKDSKPGKTTGTTALHLMAQADEPGETGEAASHDESVKDHSGDDFPGEPGKREKPLVLVVEDNMQIRQYIREPLDVLYNVAEAVNGREGIDKALELIPDLIVSDIMMPGADGYELCKTLKNDVRTSHIPIVLLTAKASEESIIEGLETGADDYITKPFNSHILLARIANLIELRKQLQEKMQRQMLLQPTEIQVSSIDQAFIGELQTAVEENLEDPDFNVIQLSKKLLMGRTTLYRKVVALTGETPTHFIRSYRLKRAAQLLEAKYGNVTEVAMAVGFSSTAYFTKCFKEKFHRLPSGHQASA